MLSTQKKLLFVVVLLVISILLPIIIAEIVLEFYGIKRYQTWLEMDERGFMKNRSDFKAFGYTFEGPTNYQFDENGNRITQINPKSDSALRVFMMGDSFLFGLYLEDSLTITHKLNMKTPSSIKFINGGVGGSGTAEHFWHLKSFLKKQKPDEAIILFNFDDIDRMVIKNLFVLKEDSLFVTKRFLPYFWYHLIHSTWWHEWLERNVRLYAPLSSLMWNHLFFYDDFENINTNPKFIWPQDAELYPENPYSKNLFLRIMKEMKELCETNNIGFSVISTGYKPDSISNPRTFSIYPKLDSLLSLESIPFIDLSVNLESVSQGDIKKVSLWPDNHPNDLGTETIVNGIMKKWYLPKLKEGFLIN